RRGVPPRPPAPHLRRQAGGLRAGRSPGGGPPVIAWFLDPLAYDFMQRALLTAVLVGVICAVMGSYLLVKRWALLGAAIPHAVLPGVVIAYVLGIPFFIGAVVTGLLTALGIGYVERTTRIKADA